MSVNPEDWDVDFAFLDFNLALFAREQADIELNRNLSFEENMVRV